MQKVYDVAIVGYGPVGATLVALLAKGGMSVAVLEREESIFHQPRAGHIDGEVMRVFQSIGVAEKLRDKAHRNPGMEFRNAEGEILLDWPRPQNLGPEGWYPSYHCYQPHMEAALREVIATEEDVDAFLCCEVTEVLQDDDGVTVNYRDLENQMDSSVRARYVVGCDGARSIIRRQMQGKLLDLKSHQQWLVIDLKLHHSRPDLPLKTIQWCNPKRPMTMAGNESGRRRWEIMLLPGETPEIFARPESWWPLIDHWVKPDEASVERATVYTFHSVIAETWRMGRLLLAGDSCHQTPPFMGQGLCAGIRDADNLYWKLKAVIEGSAPEKLLDSYQIERSPHARTFIETAIRLGKLVHITDPIAAKERDDRMRHSPEFMVTPAPSLGAGLHGNAPAPAGYRARQIILGDKTRLDDRAPHSFYVLLREGIREETDRLLANRKVSTFDDTEPAIAAYLDELDTDAVIIRPDRYVLATARFPQEIADRIESALRAEPVLA